MEQFNALDGVPPCPWRRASDVITSTREEVEAWLDQVLAGTDQQNLVEALPEPPKRSSDEKREELRRRIAKSIPRVGDQSDPTQHASPPEQAIQSTDSNQRSSSAAIHASPFDSIRSTKKAYPPPEEIELVKKAREWVKAYGKPRLAPSSEKEYRKKARTLEKWRLSPDVPPDIASHVSTSTSFYAYKAALVWSAVECANDALRQRDKHPLGSAEHTAAVASLKGALADLAHYPPDRKGDRFNEYVVQARMHQVGLDEAPRKGQFAQAKAEGKTREPSQKPGKAYHASQLNQKLPLWRTKIWERLVEIDSPWLLQAATASLTGCRPEELDGISIELLPDNRLQFTIRGAKVSANKGQPVRILKLKEETPEFEYLSNILKERSGPLTQQPPIRKDSEGNPVPLKNPPAAFEAAVKRAATQALGKKWHFSAYCYRHALAADLKADGMDREDLAQVLGHVVTETASSYGRHSGGLKSTRNIEAQGSRAVKNNHHDFSAQVANVPSPVVSALDAG